MSTAAEPLLSPKFLARLEQLELVSRRVMVGRFKGDRLSKRKGSSVEFADHRHYVVGDDLRFLDWNLYARLDKLFLKLFLEEEDLHLHLLIDNSRSMDYGTPTKLHYAKQVAAALGFVGLINLDRVMVHIVNETVTESSPLLRGRPSVWRLMQFLEGVEPHDGPGRLREAVRHFALRHSARGIVMLLSDFMDKEGFEEPLRTLTARPWDIYVVQILAEEEINPQLTGDLKLLDAEDGDMAEITVSPALLRRYQENLNAFRGALHSFCAQRGIVPIFTSNQFPFEKLVLNYLRQRGLVR
jgi:uncharacterized protein (DUF58 family)